MSADSSGMYEHEGYELLLPELIVYERDPEPTGLLDQYGRALMRERHPIGFDLSGSATK